jgi:hypothetical protein
MLNIPSTYNILIFLITQRHTMFKIFPDLETTIISIGLILIFMWGISRCNEKKRELTGKSALIGLESPPRPRITDTISVSTVTVPAAAPVAPPTVGVKPVPPKTPAQVQVQPAPPQPMVVTMQPVGTPNGTIPQQYVVVQTPAPAPVAVAPVAPAPNMAVAPVVTHAPAAPSIKLVPMHPAESHGLTSKGGGSAVSAQGAVVAPSGPTLYVTIENLNLRTQPNVSGKLLGRLHLYEPVTFLSEVTETTQQVTLANGEVTNEPWIKIRTQKGVSGWVYGAGISFYKKKR